MSAILEILLFVIREMTLDVSVIFSDALPTAVFNTVIAVILYPILKKTLYKEEKKKKKTGRERRSRRLRPVLHHLIVALSFSTLVL